MLRRVASAVVLIPVALAAVVFSPPYVYLALLGAIGSACLFEYFRLVRSLGLSARPWFGYAGFWMLMAGFQIPRIPAAALGASLVLAAFLVAMLRTDPVRDRLLGLMADLLGIFYLALCLYPAFALRFAFGENAGMKWTVMVLAVTWAGDTAALLAGRRFGRTPLAPRLSPGKTRVGAVAGLLFGLIAALLLRHFLFRDLPAAHVAAAAILTGVFGQLGDLAESMLKRAAEVKESSTLIPGHGGVLDRIDSLLFAFPVLYIYLLLIRPEI
jgi:phosphatidate cytidylyltransferase